jgi:glucan biosynthesis protein C
MPRTDRLHSLDALRAFALLLGILFHGAAGYVDNFPAAFWPWREPPSALLGAYFFFSHMFRMSLFFMIAGLFGRMVLERKGPRAFVRDRSKRILLPLVAGLPIVLLAFGLFSALGTLLGGGDVMALVSRPPPADATEGPATFPWVHLWFLYYLVIFYVAALVLRYACDASLDRGGHVRRTIDVLVRFALAGVWGAALIGLPLAAYYANVDGWSSWSGLPAPIALLPQASSLVGYGTAFAFGWLAHRQMDRVLALGRRVLYRRRDAAVRTVSRGSRASGLLRRLFRSAVVLDLRAHGRSRALPVG